MTTRRKLRYISSATILDILVNEPDGITVSDLTKIAYPDAVGTKAYPDALTIIGGKIGDCMSDGLVEPIGSSQGKTLWGLTDRGRSVHNMIKERYA